MGNIALAKKFQIKQRIQLRPLKMLAVKFFPAPKELKNTESQGSAKIYGHCVGAVLSNRYLVLALTKEKITDWSTIWEEKLLKMVSIKKITN